MLDGLRRIFNIQGPPPVIAAASTVYPVRPKPSAKGGAGTQIYAGKITSIDPNADTQGQDWYGSPGAPGVAAEMMLDPYVRRSIDSISDPIGGSTWTFKPASKNALDTEAADFCKYVFVERLNWRQVLKRIIRGYGANGFAIEEVTDNLLEFPKARFPSIKGDLALMVTGFHGRPAWSIDRFNQSKSNTAQLSSIVQRLMGSDVEKPSTVTIPANRLLRITYDQEGANFEGIAVIRSAMGAWFLKRTFQTIMAIKHERNGVGTPSLTVSDTAQEEDLVAAEQILAEMRANEKGYIVLPSGYEFEWTGAGDSDVSNIEAAITQCNTDIAYNTATAYMLLGQSGPGSYALGGTQQGAYHLLVDSHAQLICDLFNNGSDGWSIVERIVRANYGPDVGLPTLQALNLPTRNWLEIAKTTNMCVAAGTITADEPLEEVLRSSMYLGPHDSETARAQPLSLGTPPKEKTEEKEKEENE